MSLLDVFYGLLSGLFYAIFIILSKKIRGNFKLCVCFIHLSIYISIYSLIIYMSSCSIYIEKPSLPLIILIGFVNTVFAVTIYFHGLRLIEAQKAVILTYFEPLGAAILGTVVLGQILTTQAVTGSILMVLAEYLIAKY